MQHSFQLFHIHPSPICVKTLLYASQQQPSQQEPFHDIPLKPLSLCVLCISSKVSNIYKIHMNQISIINI